MTQSQSTPLGFDAEIIRARNDHAKLERQITALKNELAQIKALRHRIEPAPQWDLTKHEAELFKALRIDAAVSKEFVWEMLYGHRPDCDGPDEKVVHVHMSRIRAKLVKHKAPFRIFTIWGRGWVLKKYDPHADEPQGLKYKSTDTKTDSGKYLYRIEFED